MSTKAVQGETDADSCNVAAEASRSIKGGGFYVNNNKLMDTSRTLQDSDLLDGRLVVLAIGKGERKILYLT